MFEYTITVFNYDSYNSKYYSKLLYNIEVQPHYKTKPEVRFTTSETSVLIIVPYNMASGEIYIGTDSNKLIYLEPKIWDSKDNKEDSITFKTNTDFIVIGDHKDIVDIDFNEIKNTYDNVFTINEVRNYKEFGISHFEIIAN